MMIGARTAAWAKSGYTAKDYVQNGLIAMWDGIENAGWGEHKDQSDWVNLVGDPGFNVNIGENQFESDHLHFVKTSSHSTSGSYSFEDSHPYTWECVVMNDEGNVSEGPWGSDNGTYFLWDGTLWIGVFGGRVRPSLSLDDVKVCANYSVVNDGSSYVVRRNDVNRQSGSMHVTSSSQKIRFGNFYSSPMNKRLYCARLYAKALTESELAANYAIDKARFGLT